MSACAGPDLAHAGVSGSGRQAALPVGKYLLQPYIQLGADPNDPEFDVTLPGSALVVEKLANGSVLPNYHDLGLEFTEQVREGEGKDGRGAGVCAREYETERATWSYCRSTWRARGARH